jgi:hypothetical protein
MRPPIRFATRMGVERDDDRRVAASAHPQSVHRLRKSCYVCGLEMERAR